MSIRRLWCLIVVPSLVEDIQKYEYEQRNRINSERSQRDEHYLLLKSLVHQDQLHITFEDSEQEKLKINYSNATKQFLRRLLSEFLGTLLLVLTQASLKIEKQTFFLRFLFETQSVLHNGTNSIDRSFVSIINGFQWEIFLTFCLLFVILQTANRGEIIGSQAALAVSAVIIFNVLVGSTTSSSSMNPFRTLGPALINSSSDHNQSLWIYIVGPLLGGLIAVIIVGLLNGFRPEKATELKMAQGGDDDDVKLRANDCNDKNIHHF
ncbi:unnamed protein product [Didymodactylos carnosus]|uniref:Aquaporin n=1 Tax=Didymodactylos carnosus TaxID=1234261 RepID=A0A814QSH5_9BILA|nr:unnamed protein product [Didymodactylos carnosus]CAF1122246.1 unnamed protein product [Didymodactylos carnosus]CAF3624287.1 unnamed protein product [Didymodactylos carnosus]CAF3885760.1 unnamed protein product [Didymodactylos carnosus]